MPDMDSRQPFVTPKIAAGYMIQRNAKAKGSAEWLTPEGSWNRSIFEGAAFKKRWQAEQALSRLR